MSFTLELAWRLAGWLQEPSVCMHAILQALRDNNVPRVDHGIEVLYRFAAFDPFQWSHYFGCAASQLLAIAAELH
jgi:hypothetical protein